MRLRIATTSHSYSGQTLALQTIRLSASREHLTGAGDLDGALRAAAALHEVAPLPRLIHQREPVERAHHAPIARVHNPLRRVALTCRCHITISLLHGTMTQQSPANPCRLFCTRAILKIW